MKTLVTRQRQALPLSLLEADPLTFSASWMSIIYDLITSQGEELAHEHGAVTPARCFSVFLTIARHEPVSIADLARWHGFSHQLMRTRLAELERHRLIKSAVSNEDRRKAAVCLSAAGKSDLPRVEAACARARVALRQIFAEAGLDATALPRVAKSLEKSALAARSV